MRDLTRIGISTATITFITAGALSMSAGTAAAQTRVPLSGYLRNCDFSVVKTAVQLPRNTSGYGSAVVNISGSTATAEVSMVDMNRPGAHYEVGLIQAPRPSSSPCGPGDPGTTYTGMDLGPNGQATVTVSAPVQQGATGVWIFVQSPGPHNQAPAEFYTSEYLVPV